MPADGQLIGIVVALAATLVVGVVALALLSRWWVKAGSGEALVVNKMQRVDVTFTGALVLPMGSGSCKAIETSFETG